jgi:hypothetical protein
MNLIETIKISEYMGNDITGKYDGIIFRDIFLMPILLPVLNGESEKIISIDFDDCFGIPLSFVEEVFGGIVKYYNFNRKRIMSNIMIISRDDETIPHFVKKYIIKAEQSSRV